MVDVIPLVREFFSMSSLVLLNCHASCFMAYCSHLQHPAVPAFLRARLHLEGGDLALTRPSFRGLRGY